MRILYHATPKRNWSGIRRRGLVPSLLPKHVQGATGLRRGIYLDSSEEAALGDWAGLSLRDIPEDAESFSEPYAVLEVHVPDSVVLIPDPEVSDIGGQPSAFIVDTRIPPRSIRYIGESEIEWG